LKKPITAVREHYWSEWKINMILCNGHYTAYSFSNCKKNL